MGGCFEGARAWCVCVCVRGRHPVFRARHTAATRHRRHRTYMSDSVVRPGRGSGNAATSRHVENATAGHHGWLVKERKV